MSVEIVTPDRAPDVTRKFQCTYLGGNNNKWWQIEHWQSEKIIRITFGRVGQSCAQPSIKMGDSWDVDKLISAKTSPRNSPDKLYTEIQLHAPVVVNSDSASIPGEIQKVINYIFETANESIREKLQGSVDALSLPQIQKGRDILAQLRKSTKDKSNLVQGYYNTIPTILGHKIDMRYVVDNLVSNLEDEEDRLNQLEAALTGYQVMRSGGNLFDQLGAKIDFVTDEDKARIKSIFKRDYLEAWRVHIGPEKTAYETETKGAQNVKLLIHGTKEHYIRHILRSGLILPKSGGLFGAGIYFADDWQKSYGYSGGRKRPFLLANVKLGKQYSSLTSQNWFTMPEELGDSCFGEARKQIKGVWAGSLSYNEYIVYKPTQVSIDYLIYV